MRIRLFTGDFGACRLQNTGKQPKLRLFIPRKGPGDFMEGGAGVWNRREWTGFRIHSSYNILYISMHHISTGFQAGRFLNGRAARNSLSLPEIGNIGLLCMKHPYFRGKTSVLLPKEVRCFWTSGTFSSSESRSNACIDYAERRKRRRSQPMLLLP